MATQTKSFEVGQVMALPTTPPTPRDIEIGLEKIKPHVSKAAHALAGATHMHLEHLSKGLFLITDEDRPSHSLGSITTAQGINDTLFKLYLLAEAKKRGIELESLEAVPSAQDIVEVLWGSQG